MRSSRVEVELARNPLGRALLSWTVAISSLGMCLIYVWPVPLARRALDSSTVNIVRFLEECFVVVWPVAFGVAAAALLVTLRRPYLLKWGHAVGFVVWGGYAAAVIFGALASGAPVVAAWLALTVWVINYSLIISYARTVIIRGADGGR